jgi:ABC-type multidrug transport system fused ATPase/permease subunit
MLRRLSPYARRTRKRLALSLAFGLCYTVLGLLEPWVLKLLFDNVLLKHPLSPFLAGLLGQVTDHRLRLLWFIIVSIVGLAALRGLFYYYQKLLAARVGQEVSAELRLDLYRHLHQLSFSFHDRRRTGDLLARLTSDIKLLRDIFIALPLAVSSELFLTLGMVTVMFFMDWSLTLAALAVLPCIAVVLRAYQGPMKQAMRRQRERDGQMATIAAEVLGAIKVVQGFQREEYEVEKFTVENKRSLRTGLKSSRLEAKLHWYSEVAVAVVTAVVLGIAALRVMHGTLTPGGLLVFVTYLRAFNRPLRRVSSMAERAARGTVAGERVLEMLEVKPAVRDLPGAVPAFRFRGEILFEDVSFSHRRPANQAIHSGAALDGIQLQLHAGERVAVVGPTGAGKTTLASLIPRFYDPTAGRVLLDGVDVREFTLASLRQQVSLVFQEPILFAATIAENIGYGKEGATQEEIIEAAVRAGIHPLIAELPEGYDTVLGERGGTLSGGQRQCVAIARAMIKDSPIVILDEPTSGLDRRSSALVAAALRRLMEGRTVIWISHQLGSVQDADRIVVLDGGRIVDEGTHDALLSREGLYRTLRLFPEGEPRA